MNDFFSIVDDSIQPLIRRRAGMVEFPVHYMRGGTSTGLVLWELLLPHDKLLREELLRHLMGAPLVGRNPRNRQITGLGRGYPTSNKVFLARIEKGENGKQQLVSTLAQLASDHSEIDWRVNCGNMSSALPLWAVDMNFLEMPATGGFDIVIRNTNTGVVTIARMVRNSYGQLMNAEIPGVDGLFPQVDLFLCDPVGNKTGKLLPTGAVKDIIAGYTVSCVDVAVPMVIADATEFGKTGHESIAELEADSAFMTAFRNVWIEAGLLMQLRHSDGRLLRRTDLGHSETIPKACIVSAPQGRGHISVRYFTPQSGHASMAVSGACCLGAATLIPGTVAHQVACKVACPEATLTNIEIGIENPAGILETTVTAKMVDKQLTIQGAAYRRSAQILIRGYVPLYHASSSLIEHLCEGEFSRDSKQALR